ncbi:hypothetical protein BFP76_03260 [Amylibacter kogurei]|uniref:Biopolymer transporter ExbD n=1 Tax=Paramylibacter kogurei TaxID=1889778 RepID=A0A2G5K6C7_9RHOB|nr:biopolymer transporter ExbD [Amylibacter kogurei]PIB24254.1 hypothetical protein BFP76_03260 [Amylibacter kogurei]
MDFSTKVPRQRSESIVPMINVVFLLLIFFLMTSVIKQPAPFELTPPNADQLRMSEGEMAVYVSNDGMVRFDTFENDIAWQRLKGRIDAKTNVKLHVDASLPAPILAQVMAQFRTVGAANVEIITTAK